MNPELLKKCLSGNASDAEWERYLVWMSGNSIEDDLEGTMSAESSVKMRAWQNISHQNQQADRSKRSRKIALFTGIAASILCVCYFSFMALTQHHHQAAGVYTYVPGEEQENNFNGILVKLAKDSRVSLHQKKETAIDLHFKGSVMLSNTTDEDRYIDIKSGTGEGVRKMCLRKGHSYFLSYFNFKFEEVIMIDKQSLLDIPPALAMNISQKFDL